MNTGNNRTENEAVARGDDYLWDGSGKPDPEIQRLEVLLGRFRHDRHAPEFPKIVPDRRWTFLPRRVGLFPGFGDGRCRGGHRCGDICDAREEIVSSYWGVLECIPRGRNASNRPQGHQQKRRNQPSRRVGQVLETDSQSQEPACKQTIPARSTWITRSASASLSPWLAGLKRIALDRGTIHVHVWAPAGQFVVDTPSAVIVDLGCTYTLQVDDSGAGLVHTSLGWVGFKLNGREAFIPAGAACATRPKVGPGTPYFEDASSEFRAALARFDLEDTPQPRAGDLAIVLDQARKRDALTLWHLLVRVEDEGQRVLVYARLRELAPPPAGVTQEGILRLDQPMLDQWWNELGFDDISVWRHWERSWSGAPSPVREK